MTNAFQWLWTNYEVLAWDWPYVPYQRTCNQNLPRVKVNVDKTISVKANHNSLKAAIMLNPVAVALQANGYNYGKFQNYRGGIFDDCDGSWPDHAGVIVGWGKEDTIEYYIFRNQWGTRWGEGGYMRIKKDGDSVNRSCGILQHADYV